MNPKPYEAEWKTRKQRIDPKLDSAGWKLRRGKPSAADRTEEEGTANGPADYALWRIVAKVEDLVVVRSGNAGVACVIPPELKEANCSDLVVMRPSRLLDPRYGAIFINSADARAHIDGVKVGIAQGHFNIGSARETPISLPPFIEQLEIVVRVHRMFALADAIEQRVSRAALGAERLPQAILSKAFSGELVPIEAELARLEGRDCEPASVLLERIKNESASEPSKTKQRATRRRQEVTA